MRVKVLLFAAAAQQTGQREVWLDVAAPTTIDDIARLLLDAHPGLEKVLSISRWAVDHQFVPGGTRIDATQEIALIPPVSGG